MSAVFISSGFQQIKNAKPGDEGLYCCRVYNEAGEVFSGCCNVAVSKLSALDFTITNGQYSVFTYS